MRGVGRDPERRPGSRSAGVALRGQAPLRKRPAYVTETAHRTLEFIATGSSRHHRGPPAWEISSLVCPDSSGTTDDLESMG